MFLAGDHIFVSVVFSLEIVKTKGLLQRMFVLYSGCSYFIIINDKCVMNLLFALSMVEKRIRV